MIDWEYMFGEWLEQRRETAAENGFEYILVRVDVPNTSTMSIEVSSSFYHDDPGPFEDDDLKRVFKVDDGEMEVGEGDN